VQVVENKAESVADEVHYRVTPGAVHDGANDEDCSAVVLGIVVGADVVGHLGLHYFDYRVLDHHGTETETGGACHTEVPLLQVLVCRLAQVLHKHSHKVPLGVLDDPVRVLVIAGQRVLFLDDGAPEFD